MRDPTQRFSDRVVDYVRSRPGYPPELIDLLVETAGLAPDDVVADVGAGTGKLARLFLDHGNRVFGIEPNREMREAGERKLSVYPRYVGMDGRAEHTGLPEASVDMVVAGQAFHWFRPDEARREFLRILRPGRGVLLVWNDRDEAASTFMRGYEQLLRDHGTDYRQVHHRRFGLAEIEAFYGVGRFSEHHLTYRQVFDGPGLGARMRSSSYVPAPGQRGHDALMRQLDLLFDAHQRDGRVTFEYRTRVYFGRPFTG
jgi:SAM-dependent methyltransferase